MANETKQKAPRRYEKMRDSGVEWIGMVPEHWNVERLQWHLEEINHTNNPVKTANILSLTNKLGVVPYEEKGNQGNKAKENLSDYKLAYPNCIVANSMNILIGSVGLCNYFGCVSPVYYVFKAKDLNDIRFFNYVFGLTNFQKELRKYANGILEIRLRVSASNILKRRVAIPPYSEQLSIADFLDNIISKIDSIIAEAKASIEEYKAWKSSIIYEAVTKGLDPTAEMKDSGVDIIGTIPAHWKSSRLKFLCSIMTGNQDTQNAVPDGEYPFYVRSPIVERSNVYTFDGEGILMAGDGAGAGRVFHHAFGKYAIHQRVYCFYNFRETVSDYLFFYMSELFSKEMDKGSAQSTVPSVRMPMITNFVVCLPPISEQNEIVSYLKKRIDSIESIIQAKEELIADLESYKKSLIYEVVTGKRKVV